MKLAVETMKVFRPWPASQALLDWGMGIHTVYHMRRFVSIFGVVARQPIKGTIGVPQQDPISMAAASHVDDRLLFTETDSSELQHAFDSAETWGRQRNFALKSKPVVRLGVSRSPLLWFGSW